MVTSKPWTLIQNKGFSETHDQWLNTVSGFILVQHHPEGVESCEQGVESQEEELHEVDKEEEAAEVLIGFAENENDERMRDEEMDGGDAVMRAEDKEDVDEAQNEEEVMEEGD